MLKESSREFLLESEENIVSIKITSPNKVEKDSIREAIHHKYEECYLNEIFIKKYGAYTDMTSTKQKIIDMKIKEKSPRMVKFINGITRFDSLENKCLKCKNELTMEYL